MSKFPRATCSQGWTGITEAPDPSLSPVTLLSLLLSQYGPSTLIILLQVSAGPVIHNSFGYTAPPRYHLWHSRKRQEHGDTQSPQALKVADLHSSIIVI